ncbi:hypothetical protein V866_003307 [Kwoniella sp. B9012]|uniref:Uncharacterized protein n=1 Tax=Kwoniella europaea PYCC6329 TaxID=1423913 RepID=A0AAX4KGM0_9TREE
MEDLLRAVIDQPTELTIMDQVRLATAMTMYRIKPSHMTMQEFLYQCRQQIRVRQAQSNSEANPYKPVEENDDLRMVIGMMREEISSMQREMRKMKDMKEEVQNVNEQGPYHRKMDEGRSKKNNKSV